MSFDILERFYKQIPILLLLWPLQIFAEDVVVITADRIQSAKVKTANDVRIFTAKEISNSNANSLPELLSHESDLEIITSGQANSNTSLFLRGTDSSHTLVVLDGITMNDPGNPNRQFDIGKLSLNNLEKIEILKGSQGLAYGSNAIGGVIVLTSKKAHANRTSGEHFYNIGSFQTYNAGLNLQKKIENLKTSFGIDLFKTNGFSAANEKRNPGAEKDGSTRITLDLNSAYDLSSEYTADFTTRYDQSSIDLDKGGGVGSDDPNDKLSEQDLYSQVQLKKFWNGVNAESRIGVNHSYHRRIIDVKPDRINSENSNSITNGQLTEVYLEHLHSFNEFLIQNVKLNFQHESIETGNSNEKMSGLVYEQFDIKDIIFNMGIRLDHNKVYKDHFTYKTALGFKVRKGLIKFSNSTGFRAPSLSQLYAPIYGNPNLKPETSQSYELSYDGDWSDVINTSSSLFFTKIDNRLSYIPVTFYNTNDGKVEILGLEQSVQINWQPRLNQHLSLTLLKTKDQSSGLRLIRRPDLSVRNFFDLKLNDQHFFGCEFSFTSNKNDIDNLGNRVVIPSYLLTHLTYKYRPNIQSDFFIKIKNVLDKDYEETYGYGTGGRSITTGAHFSF